MSKWTRNDRLAPLIAERGLSTSGFRRTFRRWAEDAANADLAECDPDDEPFSFEEAADVWFGEFFGNYAVVPAAYRIRDNVIEIYEVESTKEISDYKLQLYGTMADVRPRGYCVELHILDRYDHEIVAPPDLLERFCFNSAEQQRELKKAMRSRAQFQHHAPAIITKIDNRKAQAIVRAVINLGLIKPGDF